ncbi:MAG: leucine-rich repeat domain-containing protein [Limisphaerales bacterium]
MKTNDSLPTSICPQTMAERLRSAFAARLLPLLVLLTLPAATLAQFTYTTDNGQITITGLTGSGGAVNIPATINGLPVTLIGNQTFSGCTSLTSVTIPNSVTSIGDGAFQGCTSLSAITVGALNSSYSSVDGVLFDKSQTTIIRYPGGKTGSYTIPNSVTSIRDGAFSGCASLSAITIGALNSSYSSVDGVLFDKSQTTLIQYPGGKTGSYTIPNSVTSIGSQAFQGCTGLNSVTIGNSVTSIGNSMFYGCSSLTSVTIGNSVTSIGYYPFQGCTSLTRVDFEGNAPDLGWSVFDSSAKAIVYYLPGTTGWGPTFAGRPSALWSPQVLTSDASFGVHAGRFGFTITWASDRVIVVEACTDLAHPTWSAVGTNTLTGGSSYFSDSQWTNHPTRLYRLRSQ